MKVMPYGILGQTAPSLTFSKVIDSNSNATNAASLNDFGDSVKLLFCFQAGCPSCHTKGFPVVQQLVSHFSGDIEAENLTVMAIQTPFESRDSNNQSRLTQMQKEYELAIPFAHDDHLPRPKIMTDYRNGGTPWFIVIDKNNRVIYNDFNIDATFATMLINSALSADNDVPESVRYTTVDNTQESRYEITLDHHHTAIVEYTDKDGLCYINHAEVPSDLRGKGYGAVMMEAALEKIESQGKTIVPICRYAKHYAHRYHRWAHLLA